VFKLLAVLLSVFPDCLQIIQGCILHSNDNSFEGVTIERQSQTIKMNKILYEKARLQLLEIRYAVEVQAKKGWDIDPPWVDRGKNGQFGGSSKSAVEQIKDSVSDASAETGKSIADSYNSGIVGMEHAIKKTQELVDSLSDDTKKEAKKVLTSSTIKDLHESIGKTLSEVSKETEKMYKKIVKNVGETLDPKKIVSSINDTIKYFTDHPERAFIGITKTYALIAGGVATIACIGAAATASAVGIASLTGAVATAEETVAVNGLLGIILVKEGPKAAYNLWVESCIKTLEESFEKSVAKQDKKKQIRELTKKLDKINDEIKILFLKADRELSKTV
jgi:hypothetical protein